jgi:hypothetical protein
MTFIKAVEMTRKIRDAQHEQLKDKTWEERVAFYHEQAQALHQALRRCLESEVRREPGS